VLREGDPSPTSKTFQAATAGICAGRRFGPEQNIFTHVRRGAISGAKNYRITANRVKVEPQSSVAKGDYPNKPINIRELSGARGRGTS